MWIHLVHSMIGIIRCLSRQYLTPPRQIMFRWLSSPPGARGVERDRLRRLIRLLKKVARAIFIFILIFLICFMLAVIMSIPVLTGTAIANAVDDIAAPRVGVWLAMVSAVAVGALVAAICCALISLLVDLVLGFNPGFVTPICAIVAATFSYSDISNKNERSVPTALDEE